MGVRIKNSPKKHFQKHRFKLWLAVFFLLLCAVVLFAFFNQLVLAKVSGVLLVVLLSVVLRWWLHISKLKATYNAPINLNTNDWYDLQQVFPFLKNLESFKKDLVSAQIGLLLANVIFLDEPNKLMSRKNSLLLSLYIVVKNWDSEIELKDVIIMFDDSLKKFDHDVENLWLVSNQFDNWITSKNVKNWGELVGLAQQIQLIQKKD